MMIFWTIVLGLVVFAVFYARDKFLVPNSIPSSHPESEPTSQEKELEVRINESSTQRQNSDEGNLKSTTKALEETPNSLPEKEKADLRQIQANLKDKPAKLSSVNCESEHTPLSKEETTDENKSCSDQNTLTSNLRKGSVLETNQPKDNQMSELTDDDLLDAACDDLDDMLDLAADDLLNEDIPQQKTQTARGSLSKETISTPASNTVPKVWQEALNVLDVKEKIEWAGIIQADISKQAKQDYGYRIYSKAYRSGRGMSKPSKRNSADMNVDGVFSHLLKRSIETTVPRRSDIHKELLEKVLKDDKLRSLFKLQLTRDLSTRLKSVQSDIDNVKAEPTRFPYCSKVC